MKLEGHQIIARRLPLACIFAVTFAHFGLAGIAAAFVPGERWSVSALGPIGNMGDPLTLTWSIVPDGTPIPGEEDSDLISFFDTNFGAGPGGTDLTQRPWFPHLSAAFERWDELGGITLQYEPNDDGLKHGSFSGLPGVRGDIRLAAASIDGVSNTLAYSYYPDNADVVFDSDDAPFLSNPSADYRRLRNTLMHELGHGIGLEHVVSSDAAFLLEPSIHVGFDGPQLDDIRGIHWFYGDALEKSNGGLGNDTPALATSLGAISGGGMVSIGADAGPDTVVARDETDFVSIANHLDYDFFSFSIAEPSAVNVLLTPWGGTFSQGTQGGEQTAFDANARSDLTLALLDATGINLLTVAGDHPAGHTESITNFPLASAGEYILRVTGSTSIVQLYQLDISVVAPVSLLAGDYNGDGSVDAADFTVWSDSFGQTGLGVMADGNGDEIVDQLDYDVWKLNFGQIAASTTALPASSVPESSGLALALLAGSQAIFRRSGRFAKAVPN